MMTPSSPAQTTHTARSVWALRRIAADPIAFLQTLARQGDIVPFSIGKRAAVLLNHPAHIEEVLVTRQDTFVKGPAFERVRRLLGNGLLTAEGTTHRRRRRLAQPAFHRAQMERYGDTMVAHAARRRDTWRHGQPIDVAQEMAGLTFAIIGEALFGVDVEPYAAQVRQAVTAATASADSLVSLLAPVRRVDRARKQLEVVIDQIIDLRRHSTGGGNRGNDLLSMLFEAEDEDTPSHQLRDDALTILLAGHDTIANALTWTWTLLAQHPEAEARLATEVRTAVGSRLPAASDVPALTYTRSVLAESLRMRPPAWVLARLATQPVRIDTTLIPAGSLVIMSQYLVHRDPRFFAEPLAFHPDRWQSDAPAARPKLAYFPFGAGPRSCIGEPFAWMEGVLLLATLAQQWRLKPAAFAPSALRRANAVPTAQITLRPSGPVWMVPESVYGIPSTPNST